MSTVPRSPYPDGDRSILACPSCGSGEYLWNAKPRFGKTLSVYDFCKQVDAQTVLIVTNRPAIANSWYSDYSRHNVKQKALGLTPLLCESF